MKSKQIISISILSLLMLSPMFVSAQTVTGSASASVDTGTTGSSSDSTSIIVSPRDTASGLPTGKRQHGEIIIKKELDRVMASGTKPLSPALEKQMRMRDVTLEHRASTTSVRKEEAQERKGERMQERGEMLKGRANLMITRMSAAIDRFSTLADRIDSRIAKLKASGVDTSTAEAKIAIARTKIAEAGVAVTLAKSGVSTAVITADADVSVKPVDAGKAVREALQKALTAIEGARKALVEAIVSLRANIKVEGSTHATTTVMH